jgi:hypothetical protein
MEGSLVLRLIVFVMVGVILSTITLAAISYGAFRLRERRRPLPKPANGGAGPVFFERVHILTPREEGEKVPGRAVEKKG